MSRVSLLPHTLTATLGICAKLRANPLSHRIRMQRIFASMGHTFVLWRGTTFDVQQSRVRSRQPGATTRIGAIVPPHPLADADRSADLLLEQKRSLEQLNTWFEVALNNMVRGLSMFDADQRLIVCNKSYRQMYSLPEELTRPGTPLAEIVRYHVHARDGPRRPVEERSSPSGSSDHVAKLAEGRSFSQVQHLRCGRTLLVTYQPLADGGWVDIQEDITEKRRTEEKIEWLAHHDALTGVANRFHFRETFEQALKGLGKGSALALHWIDLDEFKEVNDTYGHPIGDALLKAVAQRLRTSIRKIDFLARLGGDEFAIIQAGAVRSEQCERLAKRVLAAISKPYNILGHPITISASLGIVRAPAHGRTADELLKNADVALYNVKSAGPPRLRDLSGAAAAGTSTRSGGSRPTFRPPSSREQFELHYQPILSLRTHHVVELRGAVALAPSAQRRDPAGGIPPGRREDRRHHRHRPLGAGPGVPRRDALGRRADRHGQPVAAAVRERRPDQHRAAGARRRRPAGFAARAGDQRSAARARQGQDARDAAGAARPRRRHHARQLRQGRPARSARCARSRSTRSRSTARWCGRCPAAPDNAGDRQGGRHARARRSAWAPSPRASRRSTS